MDNTRLIEGPARFVCLHADIHAYCSGLLTMRCRGVNKMLSEIPTDVENVTKEMRDREILRVGMIAELDAVNLYEQLAAMADDEKIKAVLMDIAKEEKTHMGEFQTLLLMKDKEQVEELAKGKEEVDELFE